MTDRLSNHLFFFSHLPDGSTAVKKVFGNGFLDVLDDAFWMLPFSSVRQAQLVRQDHHISIDDTKWTQRREKIMGEHRKDGAREQLTASWKAWVASEAFQEMKAVADEGAIAGEDVPERDE